MISDSEKKTHYVGDLSDMEGRNKGEILGVRPRSNKMFNCWGLKYPQDNLEVIRRFEEFRQSNGYNDATPWREKIVYDIDKQIRDKRLDKVPENSSCNLYVSFFLMSEDKEKLGKDDNLSDVDNLLKLFLDTLIKKGKEKLYGGFHFLIEDDIYFRGIRAERELVNSKKEEGAVFSYFLTKTFEITGVTEISENHDLKKYRKRWKRPIRLITAKEHVIINGEKSITKEYRFIDNAPGQVIQVKPGEMHPDAIPGYDWKKDDIVEGCMVFRRQPTSAATSDQDDDFYWLKKWPSPY